MSRPALFVRLAALGLASLPVAPKTCDWQCGGDWDAGRCVRFVCR